ncbi:MAG TPA: protein kinase [Actinoplanes sp.]|nr:protein kinase [Actinoplanes sp.]
MAVRRMLVADRYRLHEPVGTGGMGRVWMARDEMLDRDVAVKEFVPPDWMTDDEKNRLRDRTLREARSAARLNHPHVVRIYDVVHAEGLPWIVMEYIPSRSLYQVLVEEGPLPPAAAARIGLDVLSALTAAHRAGVLHRDVKPHNVLIGGDGRVVLTDFGLATFVDDGSVTGPGLVIGSPQYVSPERARDGASTVAADLWSFGATLYAAAEGRSPYARESAMATLTALATEPPDPPVLAGPLVPVLTGLLRHDPAERLSADQIESELRRVVAGEREAVGRVDARTVAHGHAVVPAQRVPSGRGDPAELAVVANPADVAADHHGRPAAAVPATGPAHLPSPAPVPAEVSGSLPDDGPAPAGPRPRHSRLATATLLIAALLGAGGVAAGVILLPGDDNRAQSREPITSAPPTPGASGAAAAGFSPLVCDRPAKPGLPRTPQPGASTLSPKNGYQLLPGHHIYTDAAAAFRLAVPDGWTYETIGTTVCFRDPDGPRTMSIEFNRNPKGDPETACRTERDRLLAAGALPGYREFHIRAEPLSIKAAEWEYSYRDAGNTRIHAATRWFVHAGRGFAMGWSTRDPDWSPAWSTYRMIQGTFQAVP